MIKKPLSQYTVQERTALLQETKEAYAAFQAKHLQLNMARGKPAPEQLDLSMPMLNALTAEMSMIAENGVDCRNYEALSGIPEIKALFGDLMGAPASKLFVGGNSSLELMFACVQIAFTKGIAGCPAWHTCDEVKFLCPVPGYDRHFGVTEYFGVKMISVPMLEFGPDMDIVQNYVESDPMVKGIWCVPVYSNPGGVVYSDETVRRFAALKPAAKDFRIFWDNAYFLHHLIDTPKQPLTIGAACRESGNLDLYYEFASTSKVTFAGAGVSALHTSELNLAEISKALGIQTIGFDKINQLRHVVFFKNADGVRSHMELHRQILKPKFDAVQEILEQELGALELATWSKPEGGYFVSFNAPKGCAKRIVSLCKEAGVTLTGAGATFPYGIDPDDSNIRLAPSYPEVDELKLSMKLFCICVKLAALEATA